MTDWTRTGPAFPARFDDVCPHPDCPHEGVIAPGQTIVRLARPKAFHKTLEGMQGRHYEKRTVRSYAHVGCTVEQQEREYQEPVCDCGASLVVDGEILLKCKECD